MVEIIDVKFEGALNGIIVLKHISTRLVILSSPSK